MAELVKAARAGDYDRVVKLISTEREEVNDVGPQYHLTALHLASLHGHLDIVQFLLDNGADPDKLDDWQCTPLHNAAGAGHADIVSELCEAGAKLDVRSSNKGKTPMDIARDKGKFEVIPILQAFMSKGKRSKRKDSSGNGRRGSERGDRDGERYARNVGGGRNVVMRGQSGGSRRSNNLGIPGQVSGGGDFGTREASARFDNDKRKLQKELYELEKAEQLHRLTKEHKKQKYEFEDMRGNYDKDLDGMINAMERMQKQINSLSGQRDNELTGMEKKLHAIQDKMYELERSASSLSNRSDDRSRGRSRDRHGSGKSNGSHRSHRSNRSRNRSTSRGRYSDDDDDDIDDRYDRKHKKSVLNRAQWRWFWTERQAVFYNIYY